MADRLHFSPIKGRGVVYNDDLEVVSILEVDKGPEPQPIEGVNIRMLMQGPGDYEWIDAGEYPYREAFDHMKDLHDKVRDALTEGIKTPNNTVKICPRCGNGVLYTCWYDGEDAPSVEMSHNEAVRLAEIRVESCRAASEAAESILFGLLSRK